MRRNRSASPTDPTARPLALALLIASIGAGLGGCVPDRGPPSPRGVQVEPPVARERPPAPVTEPDIEPPPGPWPAAPPPVTGPGAQHPFDPAPLPAPWPNTIPVAGVDFERTVIADDDVVGLAATDRGIFVGTASGGLFHATAPAGFVPRPALPPLRGFFGGGAAWIACPADGSPARIDLGHGRARLDVGCAPEGRRTVAIDKDHGYLLAGQTLRDGAWPGLPRRRPSPVADPQVVGAEAGRAVVIGRDAVAASEDAGASFNVGRRADPPAVHTPRDVALTGKGRAVLVGAGEHGAVAIEYSRDGGLTWRAAEQAPARLADDLAAVTVDARGIFYAVPRDPGAALRSDDGGRTWRALDLRPAVGRALLPASTGALAGAGRGLVVGLDREAPRSPTLDRPLWRAVFTHPRVGVAVGALGGLWRTLDGGRRWFAVPGTAGLPFTDLDRLDGHRLVAVGQGLFRVSDDGGARWDVRPPPGSCEARWVRFGGERGLADCADGRPAVSVDGGVSWARIDEAPAREPAVWLDGSAHTLAADGRLGVCSEGGACRWSDPPAGFVELAPAPEGISAIDGDGRLWQRAPDGGWRVDAESGVADPVAHLPLADGRALVIDGSALYMVAAGGGARLLGPVPGARGLVAPGDGAVLVLQDGAVTRFEPR